MNIKGLWSVIFFLISFLGNVCGIVSAEMTETETAMNETVAVVVSDRENPLELSIVPGAETYVIPESIVFDLALTNISRNALMVRDLDEKSTTCNINGQSWGQKNSSGDLIVVLNPGQTIRRKFKVSGKNKPGPFKVSCSYGMGLNGIRPSAEYIINIVR